MGTPLIKSISIGSNLGKDIGTEIGNAATTLALHGISSAVAAAVLSEGESLKTQALSKELWKAPTTPQSAFPGLSQDIQKALAAGEGFPSNQPVVKIPTQGQLLQQEAQLLKLALMGKPVLQEPTAIDKLTANYYNVTVPNSAVVQDSKKFFDEGGKRSASITDEYYRKTVAPFEPLIPPTGAPTITDKKTQAYYNAITEDTNLKGNNESFLKGIDEKTQLYYAKVLVLSLIFRLYGKTKIKKKISQLAIIQEDEINNTSDYNVSFAEKGIKENQTDLDNYWKTLSGDFSDLELFVLTNTNKLTGYNGNNPILLEKNDDINSQGGKYTSLQKGTINQYSNWFKDDIDSGIISKRTTSNDIPNLITIVPDWTDIKATFSVNKTIDSNTHVYTNLISKVQNMMAQYISQTADLTGYNKGDYKNKSLQEVERILQTKSTEAYNQNHEFDTMSPEFRKAIGAQPQFANLPVDDNGPQLVALQAAAFPTDLNSPSPISDPAITKSYLSGKNRTYTSPIKDQYGNTTLKYGGLTLNGITQEALHSDSDVVKYLQDKINIQKANVPGSYRFFFEKLHGKEFINGKFNKQNPINDVTKTYDDYPNRRVFPAYIENFNDSYDVAWNEYNFYGRSEGFWIYKNTTRSLTLNFFMLSDFSLELLNQQIINEGSTNLSAAMSASQIKEVLNKSFISQGVGSYQLPNVVSDKDGNVYYQGWVPGKYTMTPEMMRDRMTFLAQCCYPWYRKDGKLKEQPLVRVRLGDFLDAILKIKSLNFDEYEEFNMDLNPGAKMGAFPMGVRVSLTADIIHSDEPSSLYPNFYARADWDGASKNQINLDVASGHSGGIMKIDQNTAEDIKTKDIQQTNQNSTSQDNSPNSNTANGKNTGQEQTIVISGSAGPTGGGQATVSNSPVNTILASDLSTTDQEALIKKYNDTIKLKQQADANNAK